MLLVGFPHWILVTITQLSVSEMDKGTRRDPDADMGGRWFESLMFIIIQGVGKRMVVHRQKI